MALQGADIFMVDKMKRKQLFLLIILSVVLLVVIGVNRNAYSQGNSYSLMIQQSPVDGGTVTPDLGIHRISIDDSVTLNAIPNPGYRFVYWMGDVSSISSTRTEVLINAPKIVVAVFEKISHDRDVQIPGVGRNSGGGGGSSRTKSNASGGEESQGSYTPGGGGGVIGSLTPSVVEIGSGGSVSTGSPRVSRSYPSPKSNPVNPWIINPPQDNPDDDTILVNDGNTIPEPATIILLGGGALLLLRRKR